MKSLSEQIEEIKWDRSKHDEQRVWDAMELIAAHIDQMQGLPPHVPTGDPLSG